ncbi:MAG: hypothetical protein ACXWRE_02285 [Pseudobdellovibrionaceae bacterium]
MSQFRLVIVDNAKEQLDNPTAKKIISDVVFIKQKNFLRTEPNYVVTDKHDMIGTHYLIYDTIDFLNPKLVFAIRTTYLKRAKAHRIDTPLMSLLQRMDAHLQAVFKNFHKRHPEIVDCNAWFVDPDYSKKNSGLNLSDLGYFMVCTHVLRAGFDNIVGCTNETYNASRWVEKIGSSPKGLIFEHHAVKSPHMMMLVENFNMEHFAKIYTTYKDLIDKTYEVFPTTTAKELTPLSAYCAELFIKQQVKGRAA